eukprot:EG_transcript_13883
MVTLPDELWELVADFLQTALLSHVCHRLWCALRKRHVRLADRPKAGRWLLEDARSHPAVRSLRVAHCQHGWENDLPALLALRDLVSLRAVQLRVAGYHLRPGPAVADLLKPLAELPALRSLDLDLDLTTVPGDEAAEALGALAKAPELRYLSLTLHGSPCGRRITDAGVVALAALRHAPALRHLCLDLPNNALRAAGAAALAALRDAARLERLHLGLRSNHIGDEGALALASLKESLSLQYLYLDVVANAIGAQGAQELLRLSDNTRFRTLHVDLVGNRLDPAQRQALKAACRGHPESVLFWF